MGDYGGPHEGAVHDADYKNVVILCGLGTTVLCSICGTWLIVSVVLGSLDTKRDPSDTSKTP
jgi:hypothetical protein